MRYDLKKFLFIGVSDEKEAFFMKAQALGVIQFINSNENRAKPPEEVKHIADAIKVLRGLPSVGQDETNQFQRVDEIANKVNHLQNQLNKLREEERLLRLEIGRIEVFGDFSLEDIRYLESEGKRVVQFFFAKEGVVHPEQYPEGVLYIGSNHGLDYFMSISPEEKGYDKMVEMFIEHPLNQVRQRLRDAIREMHQTEQELKELAKYDTFLHHGLIVKLNGQNLHFTQNFVNYPVEGGNLFAVEGWVPEHKTAALSRLTDKMHVFAEEIAIEPTDVIPTCLENEGASRIGEDLVHIYDTPSHTDKDPSLWVLWFFALFFAFIVGDAGYGLIFLATALYLRYKFRNAKSSGKRFIRLIFILGAACLVWGTLTTSFFGINFDNKSPFRRVSIVDWLVKKRVAYHIEHKDAEYQMWLKKYPKLDGVKDPSEFVEKAAGIVNGHPNNELMDSYARTVMIELALLVGLVHLTLSFLRYINRNWANIGWIMVMWGGYLYAPVFLGGVSAFYYLTDIDVDKGGEVGLIMVGVGTAVALFFSVLKHKLTGIFEIMMLLQIFSDVLSYLRLFALGLAGSIVAVTINELAAGLPLILSIIMLIFAHLINITLGIMSGVIHGLRLNFLEWYHYSFEGGGKQFQPLHLKKIE
jgi:V/A-type H+/Na+-transporting ATPase subunit I